MKVLIFIFFLMLSINAEEIKSYNVDIDILQNGSLKIEENILYDFSPYKRHGIYRNIPYTINTPLPKDIHITVLQVLMDDRYIRWSQHKDDKYIWIKIGDPKKHLSKTHKFTIIYTVQKGVLYKSATEDVIRWNAIGTQWRVPIKNINLHIHLPQQLNQKNIHLHTFTGKYGSTTTKAIVRWRDNRTIDVYVPILLPTEGLTIEISYPKALLGQTGTKSIRDYLLLYNQWIFLAIFLTILLFLSKGHLFFNKRSIVPIYNPPQDLDVLQTALLYNKSLQLEDLFAAIIELAQKGYIDIEQKDKQIILTKRQKETKNLTPGLQIVYKELFENGNTFIIKKDTQVFNRLNNIFNRLNNIMEKAAYKLENWSLANGYFQENVYKMRERFFYTSFILYIIFSYLTLFITATIFVKSFDRILLDGLIWLTIFTITAIKLFKNSVWDVGASIALVGSFFAYILYKMYHIGIHNFFVLPIFFIIIGAILTMFFYTKLGKYTKKGKELYFYLEGLREFIQKAEKSKIYALLQKDRYFLDKLLPYAMLFGVTSHWLELYEESPHSPRWLRGDLGTTYNNFDHFVQESSSHISSSGSFTGGGAGGGGGRSW